MHRTGLELSVRAGSTYEVRVNGRRVGLTRSGSWDYPLRADVEVTGPSARVEIVCLTG
jgi:hypothetical protein